MTRVARNGEERRCIHTRLTPNKEGDALRSQPRSAAWLVVMAILAAACSGTSADDRSMEVTFDGENCTYEGPAEVPVGDVQLVYHNQSTAGGTVFMDFFRIVEGRTVQDVLDYIAADNAPGAPSWTRRVP